jgi:hypothetical protein
VRRRQPVVDFPGQPIMIGGTQDFSAQATYSGSGGVTACSSTFTFVDDRTPPAPPQPLGFAPGDSGEATSISVLAHMESPDELGSLYEGAGCAGSPVDSGISFTDWQSGGAPASVAPGSVTSFSGTATDAAGNVSSCASLGTYTNTLASATGSTGSSAPPPGSPTGGVVGGPPLCSALRPVALTSRPKGLRGAKYRVATRATVVPGSGWSGTAAFRVLRMRGKQQRVVHHVKLSYKIDGKKVRSVRFAGLTSGEHVLSLSAKIGKNRLRFALPITLVDCT